MARTFAIVAAALLAAQMPALAGTVAVTDGGSILNDFEVVGRWYAAASGSNGTRNTGGLAYVEEGGTGYLYAYGKGGTGSYALRKFDLPTAGTGFVRPVLEGSRSGSSTALAYDPDYAGGTLLSQGTYFTSGTGLNGGTDGNIVTVDSGDVVLNDPSQSSAWYYYNGDATYLPSAYSLSGEGEMLVVRNGGGTPFQAISMMHPNVGGTAYVAPQLPGRATSEDSRSVLYNLSSTLGISTVSGVEYAYYEGSGMPVLYILANGASDAFHLFAVTPGDDGVFGESTPGACDDVVVGYTFGEDSAGNSYTIQKQHITWEAAPGNTTLVDIHGSYSTGFTAMTIDPSTGYLYLHGAGDYGGGVILKDLSARTLPVPEPATLSMLALGALSMTGAAARRRCRR
ncbi:MAG: hypothetical protein BIFFINMI_01915 [Phycisphaerae bacterium]|nr:hypothetical protein [Phycisphaerae bacterium]